MTHHPDREEVMAWVDGELAADRAASLQAHVDRCGECQALVHDFQRTSESLQAWHAGPAPESLRVPIVSKPRPPLRSRWSLPKWTWAMGAAAAVVFGVAIYQRAGQEAKVDAVVGDRLLASREAVALTTNGARPVSQTRETNGRVAEAQGSTAAQPPSRPDQFRLNQSLLTPLVAKTARLSLVVKNVDDSRRALERSLAARGGFLSQLSLSGEHPGSRTLTAELKVPASGLDAALSDARALGRVQDESQASEDVTSQSVDLDARLVNAQRTEQRLAGLLANRTGRLSDVLDVEREIERVRGDIERMEAERKQLAGRVAMAAITLTMSEERRAEAAPATPSVMLDLGNAFRDGVRGAAEFLMSLATIALRVGPTVFVLVVLGAAPAVAWLRRRTRAARNR